MFTNMPPIPPRYDHKPSMSVVEQVMSAAEVIQRCGMGAGACSFYIPGAKIGCLVIIPYGTKAEQAQYRRHEYAHCNGWPANHPYP